MMKSNTRSEFLAARVIAHNKAAERGNKLYAQLAEVFRDFVGCKILKKDGTLLKDVESRLPELEYTTGMRIIHRTSDSCHLSYKVDCCQNIPETYGCVYEEVTVYIGDLDGQNLIKLSDPPNFRCDYTAAAVIAARRQYDEALEIVNSCRNACYPFGLSDF